jgi:hypothetical protein
MTVKAGTSPATALPPIPLLRRLYGFGSIYGKTIRDSRLSFIIAAGVLGGMMLAAASAVSSFFPTPQSRLEVDTIVSSIPSSMSGLFGNPIKVGTLGGMMNWKYAPFFALGAGLWSILALSGTLAGEAQRGSLDIVASAPLGKRRVAIEKLTAHLTTLWLTMAIIGVLGWLGAAIWGDASLGDAISPLSAFGFALWVGFIGLFFGGLAFALAPLLGKSGSAGVAGAAMVVAWISNGYEALTPVAGGGLPGRGRRDLRPPRPGRDGRPFDPRAPGGDAGRARSVRSLLRRPAAAGPGLGHRAGLVRGDAGLSRRRAGGRGRQCA